MRANSSGLLTITAATARLRAGDLTASDLLETTLRAIDGRNAATNAFITVMTDAARAAAREADEARARGEDRGPLHGIPISVKDLIDVAGTPTTAASRALADRIPAADAEVVTRLRRAGAVIIGKTNLHEFALGTTSEDSAFGPVHNPQDHGRSAGGSSGGSAAAVATGMGLASIGSDTGGSIRIPAAACGIVGLKPSLKDVPTSGVVPLSMSLDHVGPLALDVDDAALVWGVLAGRPPAVPTPSPVSMLRLRRVVGYFDSPLEPVVRQAFDSAVGRLQGGGVTVETCEIDGTERIGDAYVSIVLSEAAYWHGPLLDARGGDYSPTVRSRIESGRSVTAVKYLEAKDAARALRNAVDRALDGCDALVLPSLPIVAPTLGAVDITIDPAAGGVTPVRSAMLRQTQPFNLTGHPAISLPIASPGLPVGLQLVGRLDETAALLAIAKACEQLLAG